MSNAYELLKRFGSPQEGASSEVAREMRLNRRIAAQRTGIKATGSHGGGISLATHRPTDPMFYWRQNNLPYEYWTDEGLAKIREYTRNVYITHPVVGACIDIYSSVPLAGLELQSKDDLITDFYGDLFFDGLGYDDHFLVSVGREFWLMGEAFPLGSFNETLGIWDDDELMNPDRVDVIKTPFSKEPRIEIGLPDTLRDILISGEPRWEYQRLVASYPELRNFTGDDARMPVSNTLIRHLAFEADPFFHRGLPILMRAFRTLLQEEMMNAAQDAIASRLYTPLILAKLGATAQELGTDIPWVPTDDDLAAFEDRLDAALSGDFRMLISHFATNIQTVFGRETMPNFNNDHERMTERILQVFGFSKTILSGAGQGETYAADSINLDIVSHRLRIYRRTMEKFFRDRALVVAEAQEHFDYEERGGRRHLLTEEVLEIDPETNEYVIVEQPKLLVPKLRLREMILREESDRRQFLEALRDVGVPISQKTRLEGTGIKLDEEIEQTRTEQVDQAVEAQETRKATYLALRAAGLPIPQDLRDDFEPHALEEPTKAVEPEIIPTIGLEDAADTSALAPTTEDVSGLDGTAEYGDPILKPLPTNNMLSRSDEQRASMPKASMLVRQVVSSEGEGGEVHEHEEWVDSSKLEHAEGKFALLSGPKHVGMRGTIPIDEWRRLKEQGSDGDAVGG